jgi:hypothetical protein
VSAPKNPPGFVVRTEAQKAVWDKGYRVEGGIGGDSVLWGSEKQRSFARLEIAPIFNSQPK